MFISEAEQTFQLIYLFSIQDDLPEILKNKKQFAKLTLDWNNARIKWVTQPRSGLIVL